MATRSKFRIERDGEGGWWAWHVWRNPVRGPHQVRIKVRTGYPFRGFAAHTAVKGKTPFAALHRLKRQLDMERV